MAGDKEVKININVNVTGKEKIKEVDNSLRELGKTAEDSGNEVTGALGSITPKMQSLWQEADKLASHWGTSIQQALPYVEKLGSGFKMGCTDTYQLAQTAEVFSKKFKV